MKREYKIEKNTITVILEEDFESVSVSLKGTQKGFKRGKIYPYAELRHVLLNEINVESVLEWVRETYYGLEFFLGFSCSIDGNQFIDSEKIHSIENFQD